MIEGLDIVVDIRSTKGDSPVVVICYDSRVDKFSHVRKFWKYLGPAGTTPEGLCFEAISNYLVESNNNKKSYFLNISDGMPMFSNDSVYYHGHSAISHTKKKVTEMRKRGIDILSYFVSGSYERESTFNDFKAMYGSSAKVIGMNDVRQIAKTMNNLFLAK
jgi:nitric oxide reductase activation protein